jgi:hypothetical protein
MNELAEHTLTIFLVFLCVQDVFVPQIIQRLTPWHNRLLWIGQNQIKELAIFSLQFLEIITPTPDKTLAFTQLGFTNYTQK